MLKAFFDNVTSEFVVAQFYHSALDALNYPIFILLDSAMLQNVLNNIVSKLILGEGLDIGKD